MKPSIIFKKLLKRTTVLNIALALILSMAGCGGGGGGGGTQLVPDENVTITGKVDDGTANSPIPNAQCRFVNLGGGQRTVVNADENGEFRIVVPPNVEGHISCSPQSLRFLKLSTFSSTMGKAAGETISGEKVDPATTIVAQIIESEHSPTIARRDDLLRSIETAQDRYLTLLVELSTRMYAEMLHHNLDVNFADSGGDGGGNGDGNGDGGGVGGDAGDGGDKSPIANARCEFVIGNNVGGGWSVLYNAALADFREDGVLNRNDLKDIQDIINKEFKGREKEIMAAFEDKFPLGFGQPYYDTTDEKGEYFLPIPPNVPGFVRCMPPGQEKLVIATYEPELLEGEKRLGESVNPATTVFSTNVATKLDKDLDRTKDNYINGIEGLEVIIGLDGGSVTGFTIDDSGVISGQAVENKPAKWVAFSATALFNIFYKNGDNIDYLAALDDLTGDGKVDVDFLQSQDIPADQAERYQQIVNADVITAGGVLGLGDDLNMALNTARINVLVTDATGGIISGAGLRITGAAEGIICENCPLETTGGTDQYLLLTGVPLDATDITVEASKEGYEPIPATAKVVAFATVDLTIELANQFTLDVQMTGNGTGTVTGSAGGIDCLYGDAVESGTCNADLKSGTLLTLTAVPDEGSTFTGWGGDCSGISPCVVTMDRAKNVTATFSLKSDLTGLTIAGPTSVDENKSVQYTATASWSDGTTSDVTSSSTWSENSSYATITSQGVLTALDVSSDQSVTVTASYSAGGKTVSDTHVVTINNAKKLPIKLVITGPSTVDEGKSAQYTATATWEDGTTSIETTTSTWTENSSYATINSQGLLNASSVTSNQNVTVTASYSAGGKTVSDTHAVTINNVTKLPSKLLITGPSTVDEGKSAVYKATATWEDGTASDVTSSSTWTENSNYASFTSSGVLNATSVTSNQNVTVTASYSAGGKTVSDTHAVTINNATKLPIKLVITGPSTVDESKTAQYSATVTWDDGTTSIVTGSSIWSENSSYATINSQGLLSASSVTSNQNVTVTAIYSSGGKTVSDTHAVTINNIRIPDILRISGPASVDEGKTAQYSATVTWDDGTTSIVTGSSTWSENSSYATINSQGLLSASSVTSNQNVTITAIYSSGGKTVSDTHAVTINNIRIPDILRISGPASVDEGKTAQYSATVTWDDGTTSIVTGSSTWSENSSYATINSQGLLSASSVTSNQNVTITAIYSSGGKTVSDTHAVIIINIEPCSAQQVSGVDIDDSRIIEMGQASGLFRFDYNTYSVPDRIIVTYEGVVKLDTGCVGQSSSPTLSYSGTSTKISVKVIANCSGTTGTSWTYTVNCPYYLK